MCAVRAFSSPGSSVVFLFSIFQIRWFEERYKELSQLLYLQPQLHVDLVYGDSFGPFDWIRRNNVCQGVRTPTIEAVELF